MLDDRFYFTKHLFEHHKRIKPKYELDMSQNSIEKDIPDAFPELNPIFEKVHNLSESLREILIAFC